MRFHPKSPFIVRNAAALVALLVTGSLFAGCGADTGQAKITPSISASAADVAGADTALPTDKVAAGSYDNATGAAQASVDHQISIDNFTFSPQMLNVPIGTTVTWINRDDVPHTVVDDDKRFKSAALDTDDKFSFTFTTAGEYPYFCGIHTHMTGKIVVK
jgi:plastocyanin